MKAPTHVRRCVIMTAAVVLGACSGEVTAPPASSAAISTPSMFAPSASAKSLVGVSDGTYAMKVDPTRDNSLDFGPNHLDIPAGAVCNLLRSSYGPQFWNSQCNPQSAPFVLTVVIRNASSEHPSMDFFPAMRFNPAKTVQLFMYAPHVAKHQEKSWLMLYCPDKGKCVDESLTDASLATNIDFTNNVLFRRVKHFSGYTVAE